MPAGQERFGRARRLSGPDLQRLLREGKSLRGEALLLKCLPNGRGISRFACSIRRGVAKNAPERNRIKRWLREAFRRNPKKIQTGFDWLAIVPQGPISSYHVINKELTELCGRLSQRFF